MCDISDKTNIISILSADKTIGEIDLLFRWIIVSA